MNFDIRTHVEKAPLSARSERNLSRAMEASVFLDVEGENELPRELSGLPNNYLDRNQNSRVLLALGRSNPNRIFNPALTGGIVDIFKTILITTASIVALGAGSLSVIGGATSLMVDGFSWAGAGFVGVPLSLGSALAYWVVRSNR